MSDGATGERLIFVNIPVNDLDAAIAFYEAVGFTADPVFRGGGGQMMTLSQHIHLMLLTHERFNTFTSKTIIDAKTGAQALFTISAMSRDEVNAIVDRAVAAGATGDPSPIDEMGFMFGRSFEDPDGHLWGVNWMDLDAAMAAMTPETEAA